MKTWNTTAFASTALIALALLAGWLVLRDTTPSAAPDRLDLESRAPTEDPPAAAENDIAESLPTNYAAEANAHRANVAPTTSSTTPETARVFGRVADLDDAPRPGLQVQFTATFLHLSTPSGQWWRQPPTQSTDAEGRFEFVFSPPPDAIFSIRIGGGSVRPYRRTWLGIEPASALDLGTIRIAKGCRIHGKVRDSFGTAYPNIRIQAKKTDQDRPEEHHLLATFNTHSGEGGRYEFSHALPPGEYELFSRGRQLKTPHTLSIDRGSHEQQVDITVFAEHETDRIEGVIVDPRGQPIAGADVSYTPTGRGFYEPVRSQEDGSFVLERRQGDATTPVKVHVYHRHYQTPTPEANSPWGSHVRLTMFDLPGLQVRVVSAASGEPIEEFGYALRWKQGTTSAGVQHHDDGIVRLRHGEHAEELTIEITTAPDSDYGSSAPISLGDTQPDAQFREHTISLEDKHTVDIRVLTSLQPDATPAVGATVELCTQASLTQFFAGSSLLDLPGPGLGSQPGQQTYTTDQHGIATLRANPRTPFRIRVLAEGYSTVSLHDFQLEKAPDNWTVLLQSGATVIGQVTPPELVEQLYARCQPTWSAGGFHNTSTPKIRLSADGDAQDVLGPIEEDGSFEIQHVPSGPTRWSVRIETSQFRPKSALRELGKLVDGSTRTLNLHLPELLQTHIEGQVRVNGAPHQTNILLFRATPSPSAPLGDLPRITSKCSPDGRFTAFASPAAYWVYLKVEDSYRPFSPIDVPHATGTAPVRLDLDLHTAELRVNLVLPDGTPAPSTTQSFFLASSQPLTQSSRRFLVAGRGHEVRTTASVGDYRAYVLHASKSERSQPQAPSAATLTDSLVEIGSVSIRAGTPTQALELQIPASAGF